MKTYNNFRMTFETMDESTRAMATFLLTAVGAWFLLAFFGGMLNLFNQPIGPPFAVGLFLLVPIVGFASAYLLSTRVRHAVDSLPLWIVTISHVWRFVGLGFVIGAVVNVLPVQFGYPAGLYDIAVAALCLPLAFAIRRRAFSPGLRTAFIAWNVFGLIDLIFAVTTGVLYSEGSFGVLRTGVSTRLMSTFPVNMIPTFFVPLFILLHMLALKRSREVAG